MSKLSGAPVWYYVHSVPARPMWPNDSSQHPICGWSLEVRNLRHFVPDLALRLQLEPIFQVQDLSLAVPLPRPSAPVDSQMLEWYDVLGIDDCAAWNGVQA